MAYGIVKTSIDSLQQYYTEFSPQIFDQLFTDQLIGQHFSVENNVKDRTILQSSDIGEVLQPYQNGFTPKGQLTLTGRELIMRRGKFDNKYYPNDFTLGHFASWARQTGNDPKDFPYELYVITQIMEKFRDDYVKSVLWTGNYAAPTPGTAGAASATADGFKTIIDDDQAAGSPIITPITASSITSSNAVAKFRTFFKAALTSSSHRSKPHTAFTSQDNFDNLAENLVATYGTNLALSQNYFDMISVPGFTNVKVIAQEALSGDGIIMFRDGNAVVGLDGAPSMYFEYEDRALKVFGDFVMGHQFRDLTEVYINDTFAA